MKVASRNGFVSLLTAILISLLLIIVTTSMMTLEVLQLRNAEDAEQSMRAYYTAEAGIEDAVAKILSKQISTTVPQSCKAGSLPGVTSSTWTCQQITFSGQPSGNLTADQAVTIEPGKSNYQSVEIEWNASPDGVAAHYNMMPLLGLNGGLPSAPLYASNKLAAPPIELQIVEYPNAAFNENQVCRNTSCGTGLGDPKYAFIQNALIVPAGGAVSGTVDYRTILRNGSYLKGNCTPLPRTATNHPNPYNTAQGDASNYNCYAVLTNLRANKDYLFRLRSRYADSNYRFTFWSNPVGRGNQVKVPLGMATIDVTAQAGKVYRRVISDLPLGTGAASGLNYVMYSDTNICKNFEVIDNAPPPSTCP